MNADERRNGLLEKANNMIDKIQDAMRLVENTEAAKQRFLRPDSALSLEIPIEGADDMMDVFKLAEIFDEKGIEKIKAYILMELEELEEDALKVLDFAGFHEPKKAQEPEEDDSDMKIVNEKPSKARKGTKKNDKARAAAD